MIKKVSFDDDFLVYTNLLNSSFATVATEFGLTMENCPTNNAFITKEKLRIELLEKDREFFYLEENDLVIGFIAIEKSSSRQNTFYIEKVAVHPEYRNKGIGKQLMDFATQKIIELKGIEISIGVIDSNNNLKRWYQNQGFKIVEIKYYEHLPFRVCLMSKCLK